jgi:hypothetical protein
MVRQPAYFVYRLVPTTFPMILVVLFGACNSKAQRSPELQDLRDRYDQIQEDMKEAEVIEIFEGYKPGIGELAREVDSNGKPLKRPGTYAIMFCKKTVPSKGIILQRFISTKLVMSLGSTLGRLVSEPVVSQ